MKPPAKPVRSASPDPAEQLNSFIDKFDPKNQALIRAVRQAVSLPLFVGGGMKTPEQVRDAATAGADFIVVGSAIEDGGAGALHELVAALK